MKILYVTTIGGTMNFFKNIIKEFVGMGNEIDIACNNSKSSVSEYFQEQGCHIYSISTSRSPLSKGNVLAIKQLKRIIEEKGYDIVHCHTPVAGLCTRIAAMRARKRGTKVIYTAHGFHFYKGAPLRNWLIYYPLEKICSYFTDVLITINQEDYALANKKMKAKRVEYIPGVGIDVSKFRSVIVDKAVKRQELGIPEDAIVLSSVGELNKNKNHETVIRAIAGMDVYYIIAGKGPLQEQLQNVIKEVGMNDRVKLLGFRSDVAELCAVSDVFVFPSFREGLSVSVMEAMASGLPVVCSRIRGNTDLVDENGGALFAPTNVFECKNAISNILQSDMKIIGIYNTTKVEKFACSHVSSLMRKIYTK